MYSMSDFRNNLRKAFNDADAGHEVVIERWGQKFQLVSLVDKPIGKSWQSTPESTPTVAALAVSASPGSVGATEKSAPKPDIAGMKAEPSRAFGVEVKLCKNGHRLPEGRTKCLQKGCKYS